jgi:sulfopyruvate decarboxylase subunit alpha
MEWKRAVVDGLTAAEIDLVAQLPDGALGPVVEGAAEAGIDTVQVEREESAVAAAAATWVTGTRGAVICQSSGLANSLNAIGSLAIPARLPFVGLVSRRGNLGEFNIAQVPAGYGLPAMLDEMNVRNESIAEPGEIQKTVRLAAETAFSTRTPYVLFFETTVTGYGQEAQ